MTALRYVALTRQSPAANRALRALRPVRGALAAALLAAPHAICQADDGIRPNLRPEHTDVLRTLQPSIDEAIDRGIQWLIADQHRDGSWTHSRALFPTGQTALCAYALLKCGLRADHPAIQRAIANFTSIRPRRVYSSGCHVLALAAADAATRAKHRGHVEQLIEDLLEWQDGSWTYPNYDKNPAIHSKPDLSITHFAAMAMRAAKAWGIEVHKRPLRAAFDTTLDYQEPFRGNYKTPEAGYRYFAATAPTASMTTAGIATAEIFAQLLGKNLDKRRLTELVKARDAAMRWLGNRYTVESNPSGNRTNLYYYLYGLERVGSLLKTEYIGGNPWYLDGAQFLVHDQREDGKWRLRPPKTPRPQPAAGAKSAVQADTCFALLFLKRATTGKPTTGDTGWITKLTIDTDRDQRVGLQAIGGVDGSPLKMWMAWIGNTSANAKTLPAIARIEYLIDDEVIATEVLAGRKIRPGETFLVQHRFDATGVYEVAARITLMPQLEGEASAERWSSPAVMLRVTGVLEPWMLEAAQPSPHSVMPKAKHQRLSASSATVSHSAARAFDNDEVTSWRWQTDDSTPWVRLVCKRSVQANTLWLTQATGQVAYRGSLARIRAVDIVWNGGKKIETQRVELDADELAPTLVAIPPEARPVRRVEVRVVSTSAAKGLGSGGLAEVRLERR